MRKAITCLEQPYLSLHIDYDYLTVGEMGNILIRLQAALRSLADLSRGRREQPRFIIKSLETRHSLDMLVVLSILTVTAAIPQNLDFYREVATKALERLRVSATAIAEKRGLKVTIQDRTGLKTSPKPSEELAPKQKKKLEDLMSALTRPANSIIIRDEVSEITLTRPDLLKLL